MSIHYDCMEAIQTAIQALSLTGIENTSIVVAKVPFEQAVKRSGANYPAILITPGPERCDRNAGVTRHNDVEYTVFVSIVAEDNQETNNTEELEGYMGWHGSIADRFRNTTLTGVSTVIRTWTEPSNGPDKNAYLKNLWVTQLKVKCLSREQNTN